MDGCQLRRFQDQVGSADPGGKSRGGQSIVNDGHRSESAVACESSCEVHADSLRTFRSQQDLDADLNAEVAEVSMA